MKTLWLGCSHSLGTYDDDNKFLHHYGIPYHVSKRFDTLNWKIVAGSGHGLIEYSSIITFLDNKNMLNFDNIILQLTAEPRLVLYEDATEKWISLYLYMKNKSCHVHDLGRDRERRLLNKVFIKNVAANFQTYKDVFGKNNNLKLLDMFEKIANSFDVDVENTHLKIHTDNIINITKKNNINLYTFVFSHRTPEYYYFNDYDILEQKQFVNLIPDNHREDFLVNGWDHPKNSGVMYAANIITDALKQKGFKG